jgi:tetratricopeptide (TPR) repeat protein
LVVLFNQCNLEFCAKIYEVKGGHEMEKELCKALECRAKGELKDSNEILLNLVASFPENPVINYQCAWSYDVLGEESEAVPYYEKAIDLGLTGKDLEGALLGLGSTYRTLGKYEKSLQVFEKALKLFPNHRAIQVFYSMTLYNLGKHDKAMELLLRNLIATTSDKDVLGYKRAIDFYADKLDEVWE